MGTVAASNVAVGKAAVQSSTFAISSTANKAVDGNTDGNFNNGSIMHSLYEMKPWWQVDLGATVSVSSIEIWNRTDCCLERLNDYWVFVSNTPFLASDTPETLATRAGTWNNHQTVQPNPSSVISAGGAQGRYVRVQLSGWNYLNMAEVKVMGIVLSGGTSPPPDSGLIIPPITIAPAHSVSLSWAVSSSPSISGYDVYRGTVSGGPYTKLTLLPLLSTSYVDVTGWLDKPTT